jgi:RNA polymerase sigma-70 factor (ECF subfamily)
MTRPALPADHASRAFRRFRGTGDPAAVTEVFDLVGGELYALAAHLVRDTGEADDVVQETFLVALARARRFDDRRAVTPWLVGILVKEAAKVRRRSARHAHAADLVRSQPEQPLAALLTGEVRSIVERALASVPPLYRDVLRPVLEDGVAPGALAAELGRAPGTVRAQLHRGLELLRKALPRTLAPAVVGAIALQLGAGRGLAAVRADVARRAALEGPALALAGAGVTVIPALPWIGALVMSTKAVTAGLAVSALAIVAFVATRSDSALSRDEVAPGLVVVLDEVAEAPLASAGAPTERMEASAVVVTAPNPPAAGVEAAPAHRVVLRGTITGTRGGTETALELLVRAGAPARVLRTEPVSGDGPFVVDLTEDLPGFDPSSSDLSQRVSVVLLGEGYVEAGGWARPVDEGRAGEYTLSIDITARPVTMTLRGRVMAESGKDINRSHLVEFVGANATRDVATSVLPATRLDGGSRFVLELTETGPGTLVVAAQGQGVLHVPIPADATGDVDLGTLVLPSGAVIAGRANGRAGALRKGSYVLARAQFAPAAWNERALGLQARDGRVHFQEVRSKIAQGGEFELGGLEPGLTYEVVLVPARVDYPTEIVSTAVSGLTVTAPATGVTLTESLAAVHLVILGGTTAVEDAVLHEVVPDGDLRAAIPVPFQQSVQLRKRSEVVVLVEADVVTTVRVTAPDREPADVAIDPASLPVERGDSLGLLGPLVVELGAANEPAVVEWRLRCDGPGALDGAHLALMAVDERGDQMFLGAEPVREGVARFERVLVGSFFVRPTLHYPPEIELSDLPLALETMSGQEVTTRAGEVTVVEVTVAIGGRIELALLARNPALPAPQAMLIERGGNEVLPALLAPDGTGHRIAPGLDGDGPFLLQRALPPGEYTLRVEGEGYIRAEQPVTVRSGESTRVTLSLELAR